MKKVYKNMRLKFSKSLEYQEAQFPEFNVLVGQKSIFRRYCAQTAKVRIQFRVYRINKDSMAHFSQFISVKVKKYLGKSQAKVQEKLRKLRLRQNDGFLIKKCVLECFYTDLRRGV